MNNWNRDPTFEFDAPQFCDFANWKGENLDTWFDFNTPDTSKVMNNINKNSVTLKTPPKNNFGKNSPSTNMEWKIKEADAPTTENSHNDSPQIENFPVYSSPNHSLIKPISSPEQVITQQQSPKKNLNSVFSTENNDLNNNIPSIQNNESILSKKTTLLSTNNGNTNSKQYNKPVGSNNKLNYVLKSFDESTSLNNNNTNSNNSDYSISTNNNTVHQPTNTSKNIKPPNPKPTARQIQQLNHLQQQHNIQHQQQQDQQKFIVNNSSSNNNHSILPMNSSFGLKQSNNIDAQATIADSRVNNLVHSITNPNKNRNNNYHGANYRGNTYNAKKHIYLKVQKGTENNNNNNNINNNVKVNNQEKQQPKKSKSSPNKNNTNSEWKIKQKSNHDNEINNDDGDENVLPSYMRPTASTMRRQEAIKQEKIQKKEQELNVIAQLGDDHKRDLTVPMTPEFVRRSNRTRANNNIENNDY